MRERLLTIKEARRLLGVSTKTIQRWDKAGLIRCVRTPGGRRRIPLSEVLRIMGEMRPRPVKIVGYARVSSHTQSDDLERQKRAIRRYAEERGLRLREIITDIGSGLNERRRGFRKLLGMVARREVDSVIVTHRDRLTRFGFDTLGFLFGVMGARIVVINEEEKTPHE
jgi:putative resolvase